MLTFEFTRALPDLTVRAALSVEDGETLVLVGRSGCGKSTTLRVLAGLDEPDEGKIVLAGRTLLDTSDGVDVAPEERNLGYVVQSYGLFPHLTVTENVAYGISDLDVEDQEERVRDALGVVSIRHLAERHPRALSGGEQQRVALARALVRRPGVLLLDEPLSALDVSTRGRVRVELAEILRGLDIPSIVVTHDYEDARVLGHRIAVMDDGEVVQEGPAQEVERNPNNTFVAAFTETNLLPARDGEWVAFDPWDVDVAREATGEGREWKGRIRDVSSIGGSMRLHVDVEGEGDDALLADVPAGGGDFQHDDVVYARVDAGAARPVGSGDLRGAGSGGDDEHDDEAGPPAADAPIKVRRSRLRSRGPMVAIALTMIIMVTGAAYARTLTSRAGGDDAERVTVHVAANMTDAFKAIAKRFESDNPGKHVRPTFAGTQILLTQLQQGAQSGMFISADLAHIEEAKTDGLIDSFVPVSKMQPVIIVPKSNPAGVKRLRDLRSDLRLVIGVKEVPVGIYAREVFSNASEEYGSRFDERVMSRVVSMETNTKQVAQKVATGNADAAVVYRTDVTDNLEKKVEVVEIPKRFNVVATNYAGVLKDAPRPKLAKAVLDFVRSPEGQEIIAEFGYIKLSAKP